VRPNISLGDSLAGLHAAFGTVMALLHRARLGGNGQVGGWLGGMGWWVGGQVQGGAEPGHACLRSCLTADPPSAWLTATPPRVASAAAIPQRSASACAMLAPSATCSFMA